jgi:hypothetical protein
VIGPLVSWNLFFVASRFYVTGPLLYGIFLSKQKINLDFKSIIAADSNI